MNILLLGLTALSLFFFPASDTHATVDLGLSVGDEGLNSFYLAVGDYYRVPTAEVAFVRERHIPYYETPVVFFLAQRAHVAPSAIVDLRLRGMSWMDITLNFGLSPEIYYVPVSYVPGPPYGRAYGYYKKYPRKRWKEIVLVDDDVVNLVNLGFISRHYHYKPEEVIKMRSKNKEFVVVHDEVRKAKKVKVKGSDVSGHGGSREVKGDKTHEAKEIHGSKGHGQKEVRAANEHSQSKSSKPGKEQRTSDGKDKGKGDSKGKDKGNGKGRD